MSFKICFISSYFLGIVPVKHWRDKHFCFLKKLFFTPFFLSFTYSQQKYARKQLKMEMSVAHTPTCRVSKQKEKGWNFYSFSFSDKEC